MSTPWVSPIGSLESASGNWCFAPDLRRNSKSYSISLSAHRRSFDERVWVLNSRMRAEQP